MKALYPWAVLACFLLFSTAARADVSDLRCNVICDVTISGQIVKDDLRRLAAVMARYSATFPKRLISYQLNSLGGDIATAMEMGRLLRANEAMGSIGFNSTCASACVFLIVGAPSRVVLGRVVVHRPYSTFVGERTTADAQRQADITKKAIREYLEEMNVPTLLADLMDSVPPYEGHILTESELALFKLNGPDPVYEDKWDARAAGKLGISRQEFVRRKAHCWSLSDQARGTCLSELYSSLRQ